MAYDIWATCTTAGNNACGLAFKEQCYPDPANCGIGDGGLLTIVEYQQMLPTVVAVLGTAWIIRTVMQNLGIFR